MDIIPPEILGGICSHMSDEDLVSFMQTSKTNYDRCYKEWNRRHQRQYKHVLSPEQRSELKSCLKNIYHSGLLQELHRLLQFNQVTSELKHVFDRLWQRHEPEIDKVDSIYGEDEAIGDYWDEKLWVQKLDEIDSLVYYELIDSLHSDESLFQLATIITSFLESEDITDHCDLTVFNGIFPNFRFQRFDKMLGLYT